MDIQTRIQAETAITKELINSIVSQGYSVAVYDGEEMNQSMTVGDALELAMDLDECHIHAQKNIDGKMKSVACFYMVYGNDGYDCICDLSDNAATDAIMQSVEVLAAEWEEKLTG